MESEREDTEFITLFLNLFNEVLNKVSGIDNYKFKPIGIEAALGTEYLSKTVSCQWHFRQCAENHMKSVNEFGKATFSTLFNELCYCKTAHQFERVSAALGDICEHSNLSEWWSWWHVRHYHIVLTYSGFHLPGVNLAESGNSFIKCRQPMSLAEAA